MTVDKICRACVRCKKIFHYGDMDASLRGQMTRKYCTTCKVLQHRDEARIHSLRYGRYNRESLNNKARVKYRNELQKL
tara:strand:- start:135 stop:368 length:234 start_codon:yes stop_codon:yes gene_type:complete